MRSVPDTDPAGGDVPEGHLNGGQEDAAAPSAATLHSLVLQIRQELAKTPSDDDSCKHVDGAFVLFAQCRKLCRTICRAQAEEAVAMGGGGGGSKSVTRNGGNDDPLSTLDGQEAPTGLTAVREWMACLEELAAAYSSRIPVLEANVNDGKRPQGEPSSQAGSSGASERMRDRNLGPEWEARIQNYEQVSSELGVTAEVLRSAESGIAPSREVRECVIAPRGDAMLEFNAAAPENPVWRFRVSSHMLAETSPIFARMFCDAENSGGEEEEDLSLPPAPVPFVTSDGSRVLLYRMPQVEENRESALTVLLHAAHLHNDQIPRGIAFAQFVAVAEASLRYRCTAPVEILAEHCWLPQWVHKATDAMPEGMVLVSYALGSRRLFARATKSAILNLAGEEELAATSWPPRIKERVWAVRCAKMDQVRAACVRAVNEFLGGSGKQPSRDDEHAATTTPPSSLGFLAPYGPTLTPTPFSLDSKPRCPRGSHWCDATNLGWLMLVLNQLHLLSTVLSPAVLDRQTENSPPARSLAQIVDALRGIAGPPHPVHPPEMRSPVCDPAPALRAAVTDVYNSVEGLTLFDIDGRRHGWALSRHVSHVREPSVAGGLRPSDLPFVPSGPSLGRSEDGGQQDRQAESASSAANSSAAPRPQPPRRVPTVSDTALSPPPPAPLDPILTMTEEEARRILWPEEDEPERRVTDNNINNVSAGIKYGPNLVRVEEKTLLVEQVKLLREDRDRRMGLA